MKIWKQKETNIQAQELTRIAKQYNINTFEATLLINREIKEEDFMFFLEDSVNLLHNPFLLKNIDKFINRINKAIKNNENILIFGDKDADGITATIIMYETLKDFGLNVSYKIPSNGEFYGLSNELINTALEKKISLIITVDNGISSIEEINYANSKGIEIIITDHHLPGENFKTENIVINPHLKDDKYPFKEIAGCCVSFKACLALSMSFTDLYSKNLVFLFLEKTKNEIILHAIEINNYILKQYLRLNNKNDPLINSNKLEKFVQNKCIIIFNKEDQNELLNKHFAKSININTIDINENFIKKYPNFRKKTLTDLIQATKYFKYKEVEIKDKLYYIFYNVIFETNKNLLQKCLKRLSFVAIGTIADNMPIINENRIILKVGLKEIALRERMSINYLLKDANILTKPNITSTDIAYKIAPILNSTGRLEKADIAINFLLTNDINQIENKFKEIKEINELRKYKEEKAWNSHNKNTIFKNDKFIVCYDNNTPKGISSRIATRLSSYYQKVAIFLTKQDNIIKGSIRSNNKINSKTLISIIPSHLVINSGGHKAAAGFTLHENLLEDFIKELEYATTKVEYETTNENELIPIDAILPKNLTKDSLFKTIEILEPYGYEFREPILLMKNAYLQELKIIDKNHSSKHINMRIKSQNDYYKAIFFNGTKKIEELDIKEDQYLDIIFTVNEDFYYPREKILKIIDIKKNAQINV
ncbi:single-stranded-DNA-specific exonuclease RecJ [Borreliella burgdorferi]|uniref:single-stranded-DNA-specific exonuclease RecJ n=1 Tax=Borreliella burgdorferi TaxID=139 RepID=UPI001E548B21|nr:single-stranded-DNA-specific exonuclease RecJ [Borreliella burgdorferi]MCD2384451.1 single-stranded-DNA-specific exonuclease RecJ [Borreliella burgdorferi]MCD2393103.1 single-stranded-DNA-specific exonuclease RecJ [Borreliella burgdorferi]